jgi:hypothetical protein
MVAPFEIRRAEVKSSPVLKTTPARLHDRVKSSQDFTCAAAPFDLGGIFSQLPGVHEEKKESTPEGWQRWH